MPDASSNLLQLTCSGLALPVDGRPLYAMHWACSRCTPNTSDEPMSHEMPEQAYESEFAEHPDLALTWAASPAFLRRFQQGFDAYIAGRCSSSDKQAS